jgi:hypothetical protein
VDLVTLSQIANPILQTIFIAVIGTGYYNTVRASVLSPGLRFGPWCGRTVALPAPRR